MKLFVEKSKFESELKLFQGVFEKKTIMEILQNIKITAFANGIMEMVATDLEIGLKSTISARVEEPGSFTVNGRDLYELVSRMDDEIVEIFEGNDLQVTVANESKKSKYKLLGLQSSDYPELPSGDFANGVKLPLRTVQGMIERCSYVIAPELKFNVPGALLSFNLNKLEMAATDGHRLAYVVIDRENELVDTSDFIVSRKALTELLRIGSDGEIEFAFDANNLFFRHHHRTISSRVIDQRFPNYKAVIPERTEFKAIVKTEELLKTLRRILVFKTRNNGVFFRFEKNKLILERSTPEKGEGYDELPIEYDGDPFIVGLNGLFVMDFLNHIDSESFLIGINDAESALLFKPLAENGFHLIYIVMPLNI